MKVTLNLTDQKREHLRFTNYEVTFTAQDKAKVRVALRNYLDEVVSQREAVIREVSDVKDAETSETVEVKIVVAGLINELGEVLGKYTPGLQPHVTDVSQRSW